LILFWNTFKVWFSQVFERYYFVYIPSATMRSSSFSSICQSTCSVNPFILSRRASFPHLFQVSSCCSFQLHKHCYISRHDGIYTYNVTRGRVQLLTLCTLISSLYYLIQWGHTLCCYLQLAIYYRWYCFYNFLYFFEEIIIIISSTNKHNSNKSLLCRNAL
jgi:hypothetical protein